MEKPEPAFEFKKLSPEAIPNALRRAEWFRLLHEGRDAESICRDVLRVDAENQEALVILLEALCDQFVDGQATLAQVRQIIPMLHSEYQQLYYAGVIYERWAKANYRRGEPDSVASDYFLEAMRAFEKAQGIRPTGNDDAILRWNACLRLIRADEALKQKFERYSDYEE